MDFSSLMGGGTLNQKQRSSIEYTAQATSPLVNGEVKLRIGEQSFTIAALSGAMEIPYTQVAALEFANYTVTVKTGSASGTAANYAFSRMGQWAEPFYDALCDAYNKAVLRAFFVRGKPLLTAMGDFTGTPYAENGAMVRGVKVPFHVYDNCVVALPPNNNARRVPLCFTTAVEKGDYKITLKLAAGESYTFSKLGYDTTPFADAAEKQMQILWEKSLSAVKEIDPSLTTVQLSQIAQLMRSGTAAPIMKLTGIAPSFATSIEAKIARTRGAESYKAFKELCGATKIWVGFKKNDSPFGGGGAGGDLFWMIAPSPNGKYMAVEFAEANAATFVYRTRGSFDKAAAQLNRALEAISFKREVIRLTDEELQKPGNSDYLMAANRTGALQFIRTNFVERIIHTNPESWKRKLMDLRR